MKTKTNTHNIFWFPIYRWFSWKYLWTSTNYLSNIYKLSCYFSFARTIFFIGKAFSVHLFDPIDSSILISFHDFSTCILFYFSSTLSLSICVCVCVLPLIDFNLKMKTDNQVFSYCLPMNVIKSYTNI